MSQSIYSLDNIIQMKGQNPNDWSTLLQSLNQNPNEIIPFINAIKTKLNIFGEQNLLLLLDVIDYLVDNGNNNILEAMSSKDFLLCFLTILKTKNSQSIQCTILGLIKKWGETFANSANFNLTTFSEMYKKLKQNNVTFPEKYISMYKNYLNKSTPSQNTTNTTEYRDENDIYSNYVECIKLSLNPNDYSQKYTKLVNYLKLMSKNISLANEMIDMYSINNPNLKEVIRTLKQGNHRIIKTLASGRLKDKKLMEFTLDISADISRTMNRWERLSHNKKAEPFVSLFLEKNGFSMEKKKSKRKVNDMNINNNNNNNDNYNRSNYNSNKGYNRDYDKEVEELKRETNLKSADDLFDLFGGIEQSEQPQVHHNSNTNVNNFKMDLFDLNQQPIVENYNYGGNMQFQQQTKQMPHTEDLQNKLRQLYNDSNNNNNNMQNLFAGYGQQQQFQQQQSAFGLGLGQISQPLTLPMEQMHNQGNNIGTDYGFGNTNSNVSSHSLPANSVGYPVFDNNQSNNNNNVQQQFNNNFNQNPNNAMIMYSQIQNQQYINEEKYKEIDNLF